MAGRLVVNGSPSHPSRSRTLAVHVLELLGGGDVLDLVDLDPAGLLALRSSPDVDAAVRRVAAASILVVATPVYRATYTALTKTVFDLQPRAALAGTVVIPVATGDAAEHALAIDHGLRPLIASLGGWTTPTGIYATRADFGDDGQASAGIHASAAAAAAEALALAGALGG
ncbi:MAG TPA: NAD(P)H-dependent oxidoreductase [Acidimicrobiales bacterium]|nr:NAD(P)H-dependent oxidoreductase [Acidimicrobiales bacterium]